MELAFSGELWWWKGPAPWHFVTVPDDECAALAAASAAVSYGWGMIPVTARIGSTSGRPPCFPGTGVISSRSRPGCVRPRGSRWVTGWPYTSPSTSDRPGTATLTGPNSATARQSAEGRRYGGPVARATRRGRVPTPGDARRDEGIR